MTKKLKIVDPPLTRERLVDPDAGRPYLQRLKEANAVDLRGNSVKESTGDGYARVRPVDPTRRFR